MKPERHLLLNVWDGGGLVVDDLTFGRAAAETPEPASMALVLAGGVALLVFRVKRSG